MATRIKQRRDTAQNWTSNNPILAAGETGWETDTRMVKLGDGATAWNKLPYAVTGDLQIKNTTIASDSAVTLASGSGMQENWIAMVDGSEGAVSQRTGSYSDAVAYDSQGNAFIVGYSYSSDTDATDCWVIKTGPDGQVMWKNYYNQYASYGYGVTVDHNDDIYVLMTEHDGVDGSDDVVLVKIYGVSGQIAWQKEFNSVGDYDDYGTSLAVDKDNNLFISGSTDEGGGAPVFLVMKIAGQLQTIGQTSYQPGDIIWQKGIAGNDGCSASYYANLTVDSNGDVGLIGNSYVGGPDGGYVPIVKVSGVDGSIVWQAKIPQVISDNANYYYFGDITGSSIAADSQGNFYIALTNRNTSTGSYNNYEVVIAKILNTSSTGTVAIEWAKTIGYDDSGQASGSLICDSENNVYLTANLFDYSGDISFLYNGRYALSVAKFSSSGSLIWQRNLAEEQSVTQPGYSDSNGPNTIYASQSVAVNKNYVLIAGNSYHVSSFGSNNNGQGWSTAFMAQVDKSGTEFEVNGWRFQDANLPTKSVTVWLDNTNYFSPVATTSTTLSSVPSYVVATENTDVVNVNYLNKSRTKTLTFDKNTLSVSPGGSIDVPREKAGYIGRVGNFDGPEGVAYSGGDFYFNGVLNDDEGNTYAVGAWFNDDVDFGDNTYEKPPVIVKLDKDGNQLWMASSNMETYCQTVDIAINPVTKNLVVLNTDGDEGFNIYTINPVDGVMVGEPTHVRNADKYYAYGNRGYDDYYRNGDFESYGAGNVWASSLAVLNDGTPVVTGYISSERDEYQNVTRVVDGPSTSTNAGILVVPHSTFNRGNFPSENGQWYVATTGTNQGSYYTGIAFVNRYGYGSSLTPTNVTVADSTATGALFWVQIDPNSGAYTANLNAGGSYYTVNDVLKIPGSLVGGVDATNDVLITVATTGTGNSIATFTVAGTSNNGIVKLDVQAPYNFTISDVYDVLEETGSDGFVWTPTWGLAIGNTTGTDYLNAIAVDSDNNIIVGGYYNNTGLRDAYWYNQPATSQLTKLSSTGTVVWTVSLDGYEGYGEVRGIVTDADNNIYALAKQNGGIGIAKLDTDGNMFWYKNIDLGDDEDYSGTGIGIDSDRNIVVGGGFFNYDFTRDNSQGDNRYYAIIKLNTEGDILFQRKLGTYLFNWDNGYDDVMVNSLSVGGDRISVIGYGSYDGNDTGLVASLPLDGTGSGLDGTEGGQSGFYGAFAYQNVEFDVQADKDRSNSPSDSEYPVLPFTAQTRTLEFTTKYTYETGTNLTVYIDGPEGYPAPGQIGTRIDPIYEPKGGSITSVAHIVFEDGTVQNTAGGNIIPQTPLFNDDQQNWYFIRPEDAGRHIYRRYEVQYGNPGVLISTAVNRVLPIGTVIYLVSGPNELTVDWYDNGNSDNIEIWGVSPGGTSNYNQGWYLPYQSTAQLLKVEDYKWMLSCPAELGTGRYY